MQRSIAAMHEESPEEREEKQAAKERNRKRNRNAAPPPAAPETSEMARAIAEFAPKPFPTKIDMWRLVVQILEPPTMSAGGIELPEEYRERKEFAAYVGYVIDMGPLCWKAITRSQLHLEGAIGCKVGDWVQFGKHAGEKFRTADGTLYVVLSDTEILGVVSDPEAFECMLL